jgi:hypothetical protein
VRVARLHAVGDLRVGEEPVPEGLGEVAEALRDAARRTGLKVIIEPQR